MAQYEYMPNGVRSRADEKGDAWALAHRQLGPTFNMQDVDAVFGAIAFGANTGERLFLEYVPDNYCNRGMIIRSFKLVAMFDRKTSEQAAFRRENSVSLALYLWMCRELRGDSCLCPKFFVVIGSQKPPWRMVEIDIHNGERTGNEEEIKDATGPEFRRVWDTLGLIELRRSINALW